MYVWWI